MIQITDKSLCCGCNACGDICGRKAIKFKIDQEGFWYPEVNTDICSNCGLCEKVCPMEKYNLISKTQAERPICIGAYHKVLSIRLDSTSGGVFSALAIYMYSQGGYVSGAIYTEQFDAINFISNNKEDLVKLRRSKYIQSSAIGFYKSVRQLLVANKKVLVCGTPCQMAALRCFLGKDYQNLIIVDILCKSCNSPKVFQKYILSLEEQYQSKVIAAKERDKKYGWDSLTRRIDFKNGKTFYGKGYSDHFQRGFQYNIYCRPSCYKCKFKGLPRIGDITLGDFWGIKHIEKTFYDNKGTSIIFLNNEKGKVYFEGIKTQLVWKQFALENIIPGNRLAIISNEFDCPLGSKRKDFFHDINLMPFEKVAKKYFPYIKHNRIYILTNRVKKAIIFFTKKLT